MIFLIQPKNNVCIFCLGRFFFLYPCSVYDIISFSAKQVPVVAAVAAKVKAIFLKVYAQRKANTSVCCSW